MSIYSLAFWFVCLSVIASLFMDVLVFVSNLKYA